MSNEKILEIIERNDKYYILGFINGIKADRDILKQENKELKEQLQIKENGFKASTDELCEYAEENERLKKQLEELEESSANAINKQVSKGIDLLNQQQYFINYLTAYIELLNDKPDLIEESQIDILKEILQKYLKIIGSDINVGSKGENK